MDVVVMILLVAAAVLALLRAVGVPARIDLGWVAVACLAAAFALPAIQVVTRS